MTTYIVRRLLMAVLVIFLVSVVIFLAMHLLPGDPLAIYTANMDINSLSQAKLQELRHEFGLDKPLVLQYTSWMGGIFHGDFGKSIQYDQEVSELLKQRFPVTIYLGVMAAIIGSILGILIGLIAGLRRGKWIDQLVTVLTYLGIATPTFWLGLLLMYIFALKLHWLPASGYVSPTTNLWQSLRHAVMPVICLAIVGLASTARQLRTSIIGTMRQDYIRTAWSKGLKESQVVAWHALKNSLIPAVTVIGLNVRFIFGGSVVMETVFAIPGVGQLLVTSIFGNDYQVVQSICLLLAVIIVLVNLVVDLSYGWLDPRIRYS